MLSQSVMPVASFRTFGALFDAGEGHATEQVEVGVDEQRLEQRQLAAQGDERGLHTCEEVDATDLVRKPAALGRLRRLRSVVWPFSVIWSVRPVLRCRS